MNQPNGHKAIIPQFNLTSASVPQDNQADVKSSLTEIKSFEQPVVLQQSSFWSRTIVWGIVGVTTASIIWASIAKIDEAIPAQGQLEPTGAVKEVQAPIAGVVKTLHVDDGKKVKQGELLISMEPTVAKAQLDSLTKIRKALLQENQFYRVQMSQPESKAVTLGEVERLNLKPELLSLTKSRSTLAAENQLYRLELNGLKPTANLNLEQKQRLQSSMAEFDSRVAAAELEVSQLEKQLSENRVKVAGSENLLIVNLRILQDLKAGSELKVAQLQNQVQQNQLKQTGLQDVLNVNEGILNDIQPVAEAGGLSKVQFLKQKQEVSKNKNELEQLVKENERLQFASQEADKTNKADLSKQQQEVNKLQTEISQLKQENSRIQLAIFQAKEKLNNTKAVSKKDLLNQIADNEKRLAEIDSQLTKAIVENEKKISEIDGQISQAKLSLEYQELRAPVSGIVFDLKAHGPGFVANVSEPILKIVPDEHLIAKVYITNKDIGFVREGMNVDIRIDSFPYSEFGDIKGKLIWIGSDALPPDQIHQFNRFPAKVRLDRQYLNINGKKVNLQSGMSLSGNIQVRSRTVMSIFTDLFTQQVDSIKSIR